MDRSTAIPGLNRDDYNEIEIPLPPLAEQRRIVAEIETQFTRLDASVAALRRAQANLKRYRASVLKDACEGRLVATEAELARSEGRDYEPSSVRAGAHPGPAPRPLGVAGEAAGQVPGTLRPRHFQLCPQLPEGWVWATMPQLGELNRGKSKHRPRNDPKLLGGPYPFEADRRHRALRWSGNSTQSDLFLRSS